MAEAAQKPQRRSGIVRLLALACALVVSGCQTIVPKGPPPPNTRPPATRPLPSRPTPVEPGLPTDTEHNRVALLVPLTGPNAAVGQSLANATQLAVLDTRADRIRITTYDTAGGAAAAASRAIADGNRLILGPLLAEDVRAAAPIAHRAGVPIVAFSNDAGAASDGVYLMGYSPTQSIARVVEYARSQGVTSFAGMVPAGLYGQRSSTAFLRAVEGVGGKVVSLQNYERSSGAIAAAVARIAKNQPYQAVLVADSATTATLAVPLIRRAGGAPHILGTELWNNEASIAAKPALAGAWFASVSDALYRQYAAKYRARYGRAPYRLSSLGYDAVLLTVKLQRDWPIGRAFPEDELRDRGGFSGIDGPFRFGRDGIAERALEVQEIRGGTTVTVSPAPTGF